MFSLVSSWSSCIEQKRSVFWVQVLIKKFLRSSQLTFSSNTVFLNWRMKIWTGHWGLVHVATVWMRQKIINQLASYRTGRLLLEKKLLNQLQNLATAAGTEITERTVESGDCCWNRNYWINYRTVRLKMYPKNSPEHKSQTKK